MDFVMKFKKKFLNCVHQGGHIEIKTKSEEKLSNNSFAYFKIYVEDTDF